MEEQEKKPTSTHKTAAIALRVVQAACVVAFISGLMWEGSFVFQFRLSQFLILYGAIGALISEAMVRVIVAKAARFQAAQAPPKRKRGRPRKQQ